MSDRGFITWKPRGEVKERLDMIQAILAEYRTTCRLPCGRSSIVQLGNTATTRPSRPTSACSTRPPGPGARGSWTSTIVRDDGVTIETPPGYEGIAEFEDTLKGAARQYSRKRLIGQDRHVIVLCEAAGMVPQIARVAHEFGVEVRSSGGYDSVTAKYDLARHIIWLDLPVVVLHLGDLDPSGEDIFTNIREDVGRFVEQMVTGRSEMEAVRIAVTREQADAMELPTAPPKPTDGRTKRFVGETVQCEAIPPDALNQIVRYAISTRLDMDAFEANLDLENRESMHIARIMESVSFVESPQ